MDKLKNHSLNFYLEELSRKQPTPGGGSAAAYSSAMGVALLEMVTNYSIGKTGLKSVDGKFTKMLIKMIALRKRLLELVDLDAEAYLKVSEARKISPEAKSRAEKESRKIPQEVAKLSYSAIQLAPYLVEKGNKYLLSDVEVSVELLLAGFNSSLALMKE